MIIVKLIGGIGNQMFQYALARSLAHRDSSYLKLDIQSFEDYKLRKYGLHCFHIIEQFASIDELNAFKINSSEKKSLKNKIIQFAGASPTVRYYNPCHYIKEQNFTFDNTVLDQKGHLYLDGYWQSEKYFADIKDIICRDFSFRFAPSPANQKMLDQISNVNSGSIHIRRGDYVENTITNSVHGACSIDYYQNAIIYMAERINNPVFFFFPTIQIG